MRTMTLTFIQIIFKMDDSILNKIFHGSAKEILATLDDKSVHCCVTSPPYWNLRDYQVEGQIGLEDTPEDFILRLVEVFREVKRVLRDDGTLWINIGDSYAATCKNRTEKQAGARSNIQGSLSSQSQSLKQKSKIVSGLKPKDLVGVPWMLAFALRADGWYLRQDIIWHKTTSMPESVTDRCTKNHEYIFLLTKSSKYYYDHISIMQDAKNPIDDMRRLNAASWDDKTIPGELNNGLRPRKSDTFKRDNSKRGISIVNQTKGTHRPDRNDTFNTGKANKRSVWTVTPRAFTEAHFATYPPELIVDCIKAGSSEYGVCDSCGSPYKRLYKQRLVPGNKASFNSKPDDRDAQADAQDAGSNRMKDGHKPEWINEVKQLGFVPSCKCPNTKRSPAIILDPFFGAGTTGIVARKLNRNFIGIELNKSYIDDIAIPRMKRELGMFY